MEDVNQTGKMGYIGCLSHENTNYLPTNSYFTHYIGTETHSGMAITASAILCLIKSKASFIFATHMHELLDLSPIKCLPQDILQICHLSISFDEASKTLIYDRKLQNGPGSSVYGVMVARALELPKEFIDQADVILLEITGRNNQLLETKTSKYNNELYVDECALCHRTSKQVTLHTHHIIEQKYADNKSQVKKMIQFSDGKFIDVGTMHKNSKANVIVLCEECHTTLHKDNIELETVSSANGTIVRLRTNTTH